MQSNLAGGLKNRHYLVTGISSGIGMAVGELLLARGAHVSGIDLNQPDIECHSFHFCDLSSGEGIAELVPNLKTPIHGLCNAAGLPTTRTPIEIMAVNFFGLRDLTERVVPLLETGGSVVNVASCAGTGWRDNLDNVNEILATSSTSHGLERFEQLSHDALDAYRLSKECVTAYSMDISTTDISRSIRINSVSPGATYTPILDDFYASMDAQRLSDLRTAVGGREGYPAEIAAAVVFLLSPESSWINGINLIVDGGAEAAIERGRIPER